MLFFPYRYVFIFWKFMLLNFIFHDYLAHIFDFPLQSENGGFSAWEPQRAYGWLEVSFHKNAERIPSEALFGIFPWCWISSKLHPHVTVLYAVSFDRNSTQRSSLRTPSLRESENFSIIVLTYKCKSKWSRISI